ncbi:MAG: ElyC/SanA/YdcF family protein [Solirubrobacterales bacterium]
MNDSFALPADARTRARIRAAGLGQVSAPRGPRLVRRAIVTVVLLGLAGALTVVGINLYMTWSVRGETTTVRDAPHAQVAIVLGALVNSDGTMSPMLADRVERAAELYRAGKVDKLIVSGDHGQWTYDEPDTMRRALQKAGVPGSKIFTDHAGFNTRASMVRAKQVFKAQSAIVVTQGFHMTRALYLARKAGLSASGVTSDLQPYGREQKISVVREIPARLKAFGSAMLNTKVLLGPPIPIETSDGRASWGPQRQQAQP